MAKWSFSDYNLQNLKQKRGKENHETVVVLPFSLIPSETTYDLDRSSSIDPKKGNLFTA